MLILYSDLKQNPWKSKCAVACSGGFDSMAAADFVRRGGHSPILMHVNHSTGNDAAQELVERYAEDWGLETMIHTVNPDDKKKDQSWEEFWREERMAFFNNAGFPVITGHNLDDAMETWMFGAMNGQPKLIPYNTKNVYRPFILNRKEALKKHTERFYVPWIEDESNKDVKYVRNRIRHNIIPEVMQINKGFDKVIKKKYLALIGRDYEKIR